MPSSQTNTEDSSGQVRGKRRLHEPRSAEGDPRTSRERHDFSAAAVCRRESHRSQFPFLKLLILTNINLTIYVFT